MRQQVLSFLTVAALAGTAFIPAAHAQEQLWITQFGSSEIDGAWAAAPDAVGGAYVAGATLGSLGGPFLGITDVFLARHNRAGDQLWVRQFGTASEDSAWALASDGAGGVMIAGGTNGDAFVARFDASGNETWMRQFGTSVVDRATALAPDGAGGVFVAGTTNGDLGGPNAGLFNDVFLARYDEAGNQLWMRQFGSPDSDQANALSPDGAGGVYVAGYARGPLGGPYAGGDDVYVARYDSAGTQLWIRQFGTNTNESARALATDGVGGVMVAGWTFGDLGGPNPGGRSLFLARYNSAGDQVWIRPFGTSQWEAASALTPDSAGGVMLAGITYGSLAGPNAGEGDAYMIRFDSAGNQFWSRQFGTSGDDGARALAPDGAGGFLVAGETRGILGGPMTGFQDVFLARYGDSSCYADCDQSTGVGVLDVFDFLCFQNSFVNSEPYACDCDTSTGTGVCDVFDFLCFQDAFVGGCP